MIRCNTLCENHFLCPLLNLPREGALRRKIKIAALFLRFTCVFNEGKLWFLFVRGVSSMLVVCVLTLTMMRLNNPLVEKFPLPLTELLQNKMEAF